VLPAHEGAASRLSPGLWNALGAGLDDLRREVDEAKLHVGDTLLLCTDGLLEHMPDGDIQALSQAREACRQFVEAAKRAGGMDNSIIIVTHLRDPVPDTVAAEAAVLTARRGHGHPSQSSASRPNPGTLQRCVQAEERPKHGLRAPRKRPVRDDVEHPTRRTHFAPGRAHEGLPVAGDQPVGMRARRDLRA
jgi:hypothetical protein